MSYAATPEDYRRGKAERLEKSLAEIRFTFQQSQVAAQKELAVARLRLERLFEGEYF